MMQTKKNSTKKERFSRRTLYKAITAYGINLMVLSFVIVVLCSCGTTRYFQVKTEPEGALLLKRDKWAIDYPVKSPENEKVTFLTKSEEYAYIAMKRGYMPDTVIVNRESPAEVAIRMKRIEGVSTELPPKPNILQDKALLLPVDVEFFWHKGVGNLDKHELDAEQSAKCAEELARALTGNPAIKPCQSTEALDGFRVSQNSELMKRLFSLNPAYLNYYPKPVVINDLVSADALQTVAGNFNTSDAKYLLMVYCKSIRPTSGRIVGNIIAGSLAPVFAPYYTPSAFVRDNSTLTAIFIIDPKSYEVIVFQTIVTNYDIYKNEQIEKLASEIFTLLEQKGTSKNYTFSTIVFADMIRNPLIKRGC